TAIQGLVDEMGVEVMDVAGTARMIEARDTVPAGQARTFSYVHMIGVEETQVHQAYQRVAADVDGVITAATKQWDSELAAMFTPGNSEFSGSLPVLHTNDESLRTLYWWGAMGVLWFRRDNPASVLGRTYDTLMPRYWQTTTFIWDYSLSSMVHALLDPA